MQSNTILREIGSTEKLMGNNNNLNNNGSPGADIMFQMEDEGMTQLGSVFQSAYQSIVGGGPQCVPVRERATDVVWKGERGGPEEVYSGVGGGGNGGAIADEERE
ncbi:hypothetical protein PV327_008925 [Microctonus hyperodae]|uniref:Uncharacterized protein n=1 Tax=Microctonus hyperodae TaxID=165561 RepID=A0AA39KVD1_MICHY|nr:hypothetical protein PV327_008925 [Microctonus hyperodae]